jgi:hypothetical protein
MNTTKTDLPAGWWAENFELIDREIARLATLCQVRILEPGVIERVLHKDATVCGTANDIAFAKLHDMIVFYFAVRQKSADAVGQVKTAQIEYYVIERLKQSFPELAADWPPA